MDKKKRYVYFLSCILSLVSVSFLSAAIASRHWVEVDPVRQVTQGSIDSVRNLTGGNLGTRFRGFIHFGLFNGYKMLDHGLGIREGPINVECSAVKNSCALIGSSSGTSGSLEQIIAYVEASRLTNVSASNGLDNDFGGGLFDFGLWLSTIIFVCIALIWALISSIFSLINATTRPIETLSGPIGLYIWLILSICFTLLSILLFLVLFFTDLNRSVLNPDDVTLFRWTSRDRARPGFSFYFLLGSACVNLINILFLLFSGTSCRFKQYRDNLNSNSLEGVMMY